MSILTDDKAEIKANIESLKSLRLENRFYTDRNNLTTQELQDSIIEICNKHPRYRAAVMILAELTRQLPHKNYSPETLAKEIEGMTAGLRMTVDESLTMIHLFVDVCEVLVGLTSKHYPTFHEIVESGFDECKSSILTPRQFEKQCWSNAWLS